MKALLLDSFRFAKDNFSLSLYLKVFLFTALLIFIEERFGFYNYFKDYYAFKPQLYVAYFIAFIISYYSIVLIMISDKKTAVNLGKTFWVKSLLGLTVLSIYIGFYEWFGLIEKVPLEMRRFYFYVSDNLFGIFTCLLPLLILYFIFDKKSESGFYGFNLKNLNFKINLPLIGIVLIITFIASFLEDISKYYPVLERTGYKSFASASGVSEFLAIVIFQSAYMFDFIMIELIFRGFFIFGFVKLLGKNCILPIATLYAVIHFGKPMSEIISSFFGAYVLGIIALQINNIRTGIYLHCILALSIEIFTMILPWSK